MKKLSYSHTPQNRTFLSQTIPELLDQHASDHPHREAYVFSNPGKPRVSLTFKQLQIDSDRLGTCLLHLGLPLRGVVGIIGNTCPEWLVCELAVMKIGLVEILLRPDLTSFEYLVNHMKMKAILYDPGTMDAFEKSLFQKYPEFCTATQGQKIHSEKMTSLDFVISMSRIEGTSRLTIGDLIHDNTKILLEERRSMVSFDSIATVYLSTGTTGFPKAVARTHFSIVNSLLTLPSEDANFEEDCFFNQRPFAWIGGFSTLPVITGMKMVIVDPVANPDIDTAYMIQVMIEEKCNCAQFSPLMLCDVLSFLNMHPHLKQSLDLKWGGLGGERVPEDLYAKGLELVPGLKKTYAASECGGMVAVSKGDKIEDKIHTAGVPVPGVEIKIVDTYNRIKPVEEIGEICARTPYAFLCYLEDEKETQKVKDTSGWVHTGDLGAMDSRGYIKIYGRKNDIISRGGEIIHPTTIEQTVITHNAIQTVIAFGVQDHELGQKTCACVKLKDGCQKTANEIKNEISSENNEDSKNVPDYFVIFDSFPTVNTKVDKKELYRIAVLKLNLSSK